MPSKSQSQKLMMAAAAHSPSFAKKVGVPMKVAKEFNMADKHAADMNKIAAKRNRAHKKGY